MHAGTLVAACACVALVGACGTPPPGAPKATASAAPPRPTPSPTPRDRAQEIIDKGTGSRTTETDSSKGTGSEMPSGQGTPLDAGVNEPAGGLDFSTAAPVFVPTVGAADVCQGKDAGTVVVFALGVAAGAPMTGFHTGVGSVCMGSHLSKSGLSLLPSGTALGPVTFPPTRSALEATTAGKAFLQGVAGGMAIQVGSPPRTEFLFFRGSKDEAFGTWRFFCTLESSASTHEAALPTCKGGASDAYATLAAFQKIDLTAMTATFLRAGAAAPETLPLKAFRFP